LGWVQKSGSGWVFKEQTHAQLLSYNDYGAIESSSSSLSSSIIIKTQWCIGPKEKKSKPDNYWVVWKVDDKSIVYRRGTEDLNLNRYTLKQK